MGWLEIAEKGAIVVGGIGTFLLALYAYLGEGWRKRRKSPKLSMEIHEQWGHDTQENVHNKWLRYYTIRIRNERKRSEARRVRVRLLYIHKQGKDGYVKETPPAPLHLNWAATPSKFGIYFHSTLSDFTTYDAFALGYGQINGKGSVEFFQTETNPTRNSFPDVIWQNQEAIFEIEVSGENVVNPGTYFIKMTWGKIPGDNIWDLIVPFINKISEKEFKQLTNKEPNTCAVK